MGSPPLVGDTRVRLGRTYRARVPAQAFFSGSWVGKAHYVGAWTFSGIGPIETPADSYGDTGFLDAWLVSGVIGGVPYP